MNIGVNFSQGTISQDSWIRILYSLCVFMFATLILAAGSVLFLKTGNEAYEDKGTLWNPGKDRCPENGTETIGKKRNLFYLLLPLCSYLPHVLFFRKSSGKCNAGRTVPGKSVECGNYFSGIYLYLFFLRVREAWKRLFY